MAAKIMADLALHISTNVAELRKGVDQANSKLNSLQKSASTTGTQLVSAFAKVSGVLMGLKGIFKTIETGFKATGDGADFLEKKTVQLKAGFESFAKSLVELDFGNLITNFKNAMKSAGDYAEQIDEVGHRINDLRLLQSTLSSKVAVLRVKKQDGTITKEEIEELESTSKQLLFIEKDIYQEAVTAQVEYMAKKNGFDKDLFKTIEKGISERAKLNSEEWKKLEVSTLDAYTKYKNAIIQKNSATQESVSMGPGLGSTVPTLAVNWAKVNTELTKYIANLPEMERAYIAENYFASEETDWDKMIGYMEKRNQLDGEYANLMRKIVASGKNLGGYFSNPELLGRQSKPLQQDISKWTNFNDITGGLKRPSIKSLPEVADITQGFADRTAGQISTLTSMFATMFSSVETGWKGMATAFGNMLKQMAIQVAAYATVFFALKILFPESTMFKGLGTFGSGLLKILGFAEGTSFAPGGLSLVGERGPELVNLPKGAQVYNSRQTSSMLGGGEVVFRIEGTTLVGVLNKQNKIMSY